MEEMIWNEVPHVILAAAQIEESDYRMIQEKEAFKGGTPEGSLLVKDMGDGTFAEEKNEEIIKTFLERQMEKMMESQTITLMAEDGTKVEFVVFGQTALEDKQYLALVPREQMEEPEVVVMEMTGEGEDARLNVVIDEEIINKVRENLFAQMENALN